MRDIFFAQHFLIPTLFLCVASALDFSKGKFPNSVFIISTIFSLAWVYFLTGSLMSVGISVLTGIGCIAILFPLFTFHVLGAGDIKLLSVLCIITSWQSTFSLLIYSLIWGALLGLFKLSLNGQLKNLLVSFYLRTPFSITRIPFAIALLLGWLTLSHQGGVL